MIDPTVLRALCEELRKRLRYHREDLEASYIDCVEVATLDAVLDENAALRAEREASDQRAVAAQDALGLERLEHQRTKDRLAALREAGNAVVQAVSGMAAPLSPAANRALAELDGLLLRSDP